MCQIVDVQEPMCFEADLTRMWVVSFEDIPQIDTYCLSCKISKGEKLDGKGYCINSRYVVNIYVCMYALFTMVSDNIDRCGLAVQS